MAAGTPAVIGTDMAARSAILRIGFCICADAAAIGWRRCALPADHGGVKKRITFF